MGAPARYLLDGYVQARARGGLPLGTLVINVSGSLVLGFLTGLALYHAFPATPKTVLGTGFCGAYTTFSTFAYETVRLAEERGSRARSSTRSRRWCCRPSPRPPEWRWPRSSGLYSFAHAAAAVSAAFLAAVIAPRPTLSM